MNPPSYPEPAMPSITSPLSPGLRRIPAEVVLLSAGPGDLELLTLKAVRALAQAEVLLLDELVNPQIVELAPQARVVRVGKRGGCRSTPQAFICRLMRRYALQGLRVVRVKSRTPILASSARIRWLSADWDTPSCAAARVKLCSRATAMKASRSL